MPAFSLTTPSKPASMGWYVEGGRLTVPVGLGANCLTSLPDGLTMAAATSGW